MRATTIKATSVENEQGGYDPVLTSRMALRNVSMPKSAHPLSSLFNTALS